MKFSVLVALLPLFTLAAPVPVPEPKPEALNILGINLPLDLPGLNLPILGGGGSSGGNGNPNTGTPTTPVPIPTDQISSLLTPILENLGAPHAEIEAVVDLVNKLISNNGILPLGIKLDVLKVLPNLVSGETLDKVGTALNQILQGVLPGTPTTGLVNTVIGTLKNLLQIRTAPVAPGISKPATPAATPGVVPGVETLLNTVLGSITGFDPAGKTVIQVGKQLSVITDALNTATKAVAASGGSGINADVVSNLLKQIITALTNLLAGLSGPKQVLLLGQGLPLLKSLGALLGGLGSVPGLNNVLQGLLGDLLGGLSPGSGSLGGLLSRLLNGVLGLLHGGNVAGGLNGLLSGLGLGGLLGSLGLGNLGIKL